MQDKKVGKNTSLAALRQRGLPSENDKRAEAGAQALEPPVTPAKNAPPKN